jgi:hypothetical protein
MKIRAFWSTTFLLLMFALFLFAARDIVYGRSTQEFIDEYTAPRHVVIPQGVWTFEFDLDLDFSSSGIATAKISNLHGKHPQSWASLTLKAEVIHISKDSEIIRATVEIKGSGYAKSFHAPLPTMGDASTWEWGEPSEEATTIKKKEMVFFPYEKYPELQDLENLQAGPVSEFSASDSQKPELGSGEEPQNRIYLQSFRGMVRVKKAGGDWQKARPGIELNAGDMVKTFANGRATVYLKGEALVHIKPGTEFIIPRDDANKERKSFIEMIKGFLWARAKKDRNSLKIATPNAICGVRGTEFEVGFKDARTCVKVIEGKVWLSARDEAKETVIDAGNIACIPAAVHGEVFFQADVSGQWKTNFGLLNLTCSGPRVSGSYPHDGGKVEGTLEGNILRGKWSEGPTRKPPKDAGSFEFVFPEDGESFRGHWRYGFEEKAWDGTWNGQRLD